MSYCRVLDKPEDLVNYSQSADEVFMLQHGFISALQDLSSASISQLFFANVASEDSTRPMYSNLCGGQTIVFPLKPNRIQAAESIFNADNGVTAFLAFRPDYKMKAYNLYGSLRHKLVASVLVNSKPAPEGRWLEPSYRALEQTRSHAAVGFNEPFFNAIADFDLGILTLYARAIFDGDHDIVHHLLPVNVSENPQSIFSMLLKDHIKNIPTISEREHIAYRTLFEVRARQFERSPKKKVEMEQRADEYRERLQAFMASQSTSVRAFRNTFDNDAHFQKEVQYALVRGYGLHVGRALGLTNPTVRLLFEQFGKDMTDPYIETTEAIGTYEYRIDGQNTAYITVRDIFALLGEVTFGREFYEPNYPIEQYVASWLKNRGLVRKSLQ